MPRISKKSDDSVAEMKHLDFKGKIHPKNMLVSDVRSDKIGKNAVDRFSLSSLVHKIFAFKLEELLIWRQPF